MTVLVAYASAHGSTRTVAERVAARLGRHGLDVELAALDAVPDVGPYRAVVLGSAVHNGAWLPEAVDCVRRQRASLFARPVWMFSVGMAAALPGRCGDWPRAPNRLGSPAPSKPLSHAAIAASPASSGESTSTEKGGSSSGCWAAATATSATGTRSTCGPTGSRRRSPSDPLSATRRIRAAVSVPRTTGRHAGVRGTGRPPSRQLSRPGYSGVSARWHTGHDAWRAR